MYQYYIIIILSMMYFFKIVHWLPSNAHRIKFNHSTGLLHELALTYLPNFISYHSSLSKL